MNTEDDDVIFVDVYLENIGLSVIGVDALGIECYSRGVEFSQSGKVMRVFFDDVSWAKEFSLIVELSGKKSSKKSGQKK